MENPYHREKATAPERAQVPRNAGETWRCAPAAAAPSAPNPRHRRLTPPDPRVGVRHVARYLLILALLGLLPVLACSRTQGAIEGNVRITMIERSTGEPIAGNTIEIYRLNPDGSTDEAMLTRAVTGEEGVAHVALAKGVYRAVPAGSWSGSADFSLSTDDEEVGIQLVVESIVN